MIDANGLKTVPAAREPTTSAEHRARDWWRHTISDAEGDRSVRAQLRRCTTPLDAACVPAAIGLARLLGRIPDAGAPAWKQKAFERALSLAIVLSHVRSDNGINLLRMLGWGQFPYEAKEADAGEGRPILSELRFKRLLQTEGEEELVRTFARLIALAGHATDVADLARVFLHWDEDRTKRDLALTYFRANSLGLDT